MLEILQIPVLEDNYVYLLHEPGSGATAAVDPAVAGPVLEALDARGWRLGHVLNTHHHGDHVGGNLELKAATGCTVVGAAGDCHRIPGIDVALKDGEEFRLGSASARMLDVPGHTSGHVAFWFEEDAALFCGDTLFALGCGRLFEGSAEQMWRSLERLRALPAETKVFCAHEYTQANARFAVTIEPGNVALRERVERVEALRREGAATVPSILSEELATNPFLRPESPEIRARLGLPDVPEVEVFAEIRRRKDVFRG
ncbi:hydroxyacylglutathione hydrolase [Methylococcus capsulatus]|uniref:hydroxyacylglutathione hydrolase n=1 Tax=Methylococcus capsulatus TaxID=414 RepID=UPI001C533868|nr:hydroxyacylglutathione hydrolase [Methylococcus capsulatus]QXP88830.1 hydroxyacylglutathione hydrolase [Methylococcus capsulatus]QXP94136.1 hydroxyacylglutathione hydrolase [Methylococcus capsulatus]UQN11121.1 hydroxyacylglutathione hydrolase [Methylococcus capsulatus]